MGGDHHGHGLGERAKIPDWTIYKVEDCPELVRHRDNLALKGLKDPWIRNEAWRFNRKEFGSAGSRALLVFRGLKWGVLATIITVGIEKGLNYGKDDHHGHH
uniref:NADH dehydrogenase [ubiquinone] 1 beta subcomplex subunit 3 n=1 Tax=Lygus hesperus TaxID=30085 RepID=A0A0A9X636_LYGHE